MFWIKRWLRWAYLEPFHFNNNDKKSINKSFRVQISSQSFFRLGWQTLNGSHKLHAVNQWTTTGTSINCVLLQHPSTGFYYLTIPLDLNGVIIMQTNSSAQIISLNVNIIICVYLIFYLKKRTNERKKTKKRKYTASYW